MPPTPNTRHAAWELRFRRIWSGKGLISTLLLPLAWCYGGIVRLRRWLYRVGWLASQRLPVPVVVVGNVVTGGGGKTPLVLALLAHLQSQGVAVGVVSRGYGRTTHDCREVLPASAASEVGDEALLIRRRCTAPVFVAARRADAARALLHAYPQTQLLLCDDGLQHQALQRDIEICVFGAAGLGNGRLLPAGPLREPWPRPVDWVLSSATTPLPSAYAIQRGLADSAVASDGRRVPLAALRSQPAWAVAGTANPGEFFAMLQSVGLHLAASIALPDHYAFQNWKPEAPQGTPLLCTEKDAVKLWPRLPQALAVVLELRLPAEFLRAFDQRLTALLAKRAAAKL